jgi:hypothetical protein
MKMSNFVKNATIALLLTPSIFTMFAMEKEGEKLNYEDIKKNYLIITAVGSMPVWVRIRNTNPNGQSGPAFVEEKGRTMTGSSSAERKAPIISYRMERDLEYYYKHSSFPNRILVSSSEPLLIPYNQMKYPLRIRAWNFANKDNEDDESSTLKFQLQKNDVDDYKSKSQKIEFYGHSAAVGKKGIEVSEKAIWDAMDKGAIEQNGKILTLEATH